jgi:2-polyprenyl-3-methyl-5-hydroxy-6-metoxy-1,4-benzoquinol methylase
LELNNSYIGVRKDILDLVPGSAVNVLDVGCSVGALGREMLTRMPDVKVYGIELDEGMADIAHERLHHVRVGDVDRMSLGEHYPSDYFDCVIMGDVLEHLKDPWRLISESVGVTRSGGTLIASVPNVRHIDTLFNLVILGKWPYRDRGIHDRTHLRFFTRKNLLDIFSSPVLEIERIETNYRIVERPSRINRWAKYLAIPGLRAFLAFQYIIVVKKL